MVDLRHIVIVLAASNQTRHTMLDVTHTQLISISDDQKYTAQASADGLRHRHALVLI